MEKGKGEEEEKEKKVEKAKKVLKEKWKKYLIKCVAIFIVFLSLILASARNDMLIETLVIVMYSLFIFFFIAFAKSGQWIDNSKKNKSLKKIHENSQAFIDACKEQKEKYNQLSKGHGTNLNKCKYIEYRDRVLSDINETKAVAEKNRKTIRSITHTILIAAYMPYLLFSVGILLDQNSNIQVEVIACCVNGNDTNETEANEEYCSDEQEQNNENDNGFNIFALLWHPAFFGFVAVCVSIPFIFGEWFISSNVEKEIKSTAEKQEFVHYLNGIIDTQFNTNNSDSALVNKCKCRKCTNKIKNRRTAP